MKNIPPPTSISPHTEATAPSSPRREIENRANEIAEISGRTISNDEDRTQARDELNGGGLPPSINEDADSMDSLSRDPSDPPAHHGHRIPTSEDDPADENATEKLVSEGVEAAQHDQMMAERHRKHS